MVCGQLWGVFRQLPAPVGRAESVPRVIVLPNSDLCPRGAVVAAHEGQVLADALLQGGVELAHACGQNCACTSCHVILHEGAGTVVGADALELAMTRGVAGFGPSSRLACQVCVGSCDLTVAIP